MLNQITNRYPKLMQINSSNTNIGYQLNPWIPLWWSASFPGYGHCMVNCPLIGYSLIIFEFTINNLAKVNLAIYYSFIGEFSKAMQVLDKRFMYLYIGVYIFTMFDSYRRCVQMNNNYLLSSRKTSVTNTTRASTYNVNTLNKVSPLTATYWEMIMPGLGSLYLNHIFSFFFSVITWTMTIGLSRLFVSIYYTCIGDFENAKVVLDPQWFLFVPSIYGGYVYFTYSQSVVNNKQYKLSQAQYLTKEYQRPEFQFPLPNLRGQSSMYIVATFEHTTAVELTLTELETIGLEKNNLFIFPLKVRNEKMQIFDSAHYSDGVSFVDLATILGSILMLIGGIYGFVLKQGPILWGVYGCIAGGLLGFFIKLITIKKLPSLDLFGRRKASEVIMMIHCNEEVDEKVKAILLKNKALGVADYVTS